MCPCCKEHKPIFLSCSIQTPLHMPGNQSLIVHKRAACTFQFLFVTASYVDTPCSHNCFHSSIRGCRYTSTSFPGDFGPGIIIDIIQKGCFMRGKLEGISSTGQRRGALKLNAPLQRGIESIGSKAEANITWIRRKPRMNLIKLLPCQRIRGVPQKPIIYATLTMPSHVD